LIATNVIIASPHRAAPTEYCVSRRPRSDSVTAGLAASSKAPHHAQILGARLHWQALPREE
jgi:hypothetical protein